MGVQVVLGHESVEVDGGDVAPFPAEPGGVLVLGSIDGQDHLESVGSQLFLQPFRRGAQVLEVLVAVRRGGVEEHRHGLVGRGVSEGGIHELGRSDDELFPVHPQHPGQAFPEPVLLDDQVIVPPDVLLVCVLREQGEQGDLLVH